MRRRWWLWLIPPLVALACDGSERHRKYGFVTPGGGFVPPTTMGLPGATSNGTTIDLSNGAGLATVNVGSGSATFSSETVTNTSQLTERVRFAGQEYLAAAHTDTNGPTWILGLNRTNDRRVWLVDSANEAQSASNIALQFSTGSALGASVGAISTDGSTQLQLNIQPGGGVTSIGGRTAIGGHLQAIGTALSGSNLSGCGTSPSISAGSTDQAGTVTEGTTATGCTIAFAATYTNSPFCTCSSGTAGVAVTCTTTATTLVIANASASGDVISYICIGRSGST